MKKKNVASRDRCGHQLDRRFRGLLLFRIWKQSLYSKDVLEFWINENMINSVEILDMSKLVLQIELLNASNKVLYDSPSESHACQDHSSVTSTRKSVHRPNIKTPRRKTDTFRSESNIKWNLYTIWKKNYILNMHVTKTRLKKITLYTLYIRP